MPLPSCTDTLEIERASRSISWASIHICRGTSSSVETKIVSTGFEPIMITGGSFNWVIRMFLLNGGLEFKPSLTIYETVLISKLGASLVFSKLTLLRALSYSARLAVPVNVSMPST